MPWLSESGRLSLPRRAHQKNKARALRLWSVVERRLWTAREAQRSGTFQKHVRSKRRLFTGADVDIELERVEPWQYDRDAILAGLEAQRLEHAVEIVDQAGICAVDVHLRIRRLDIKPQRARWVPVVPIGSVPHDRPRVEDI